MEKSPGNYSPFNTNMMDRGSRREMHGATMLSLSNSCPGNGWGQHATGGWWPIFQLSFFLTLSFSPASLSLSCNFRISVDPCCGRCRWFHLLDSVKMQWSVKLFCRSYAQWKGAIANIETNVGTTELKSWQNRKSNKGSNDWGDKGEQNARDMLYLERSCERIFRCYGDLSGAHLSH